MKERQPKNPRIRVKNFGPIYKADIDLRPLTVFVGPNNTGKSYFATLIYALHQHFCRMKTGLKAHPAIAEHGHSEKTAEQSKAQEKVIEQLESSVRGGSEENCLVVPTALVNKTTDDDSELRLEICRCFGRMELSSLFRRVAKKNQPNIVLEEYLTGYHAHKLELNLKEDKVQVGASITDDLPLPFYDSFIADQFGMNAMNWKFDRRRDWLLFDFIDKAVNIVLPPSLKSQAYYLPADRTGIMRTHKIIATSLFARATTESMRQTNMPPSVSGVLDDFLWNLTEIDPQKSNGDRKKLKHNSVWKTVERKIFGGEVSVVPTDSADHLSDITVRPHDSTSQHDCLSLMSASATVSELAPFVLFLKYLVQPGDLIIIEEPEAHLHPEMQVEFFGQLAVLVNSGVNVLVTTHSEWMLEALQNIVKRSALPPEYKPRTPGKNADTVALEPEDVGVWHFDTPKRIKGSLVKEIIADDQSGLYPTGFDEVAKNLYNEWANITSEVEN